MARVYQMNIEGRYKDYKPPFKFKFKSGGTNLDISAFQFYVELRKENLKTPIYFKIGSGLSISNNELTWSFGDELNIAAGEYVYAVKAVNSGKPQTFLSGKFIVEPEIVKHS